MPDPNLGSVTAGSPGSTDPATTAGQSGNSGASDKEAMYAELEKKFGEQGRELGDYRKFFENISPLLQKLDESPEIVQAIVDGKIDQELAKAVLEGKVSVGDAKAVTQAHAEVQKELGKAYDRSTPEQVAKLVEEKVAEVKRELEGKIGEVEDMRSFEAGINEFIENTPDFMQYAPAIDAWLDDHDITDIKVAYHAVKGELLGKAEEENAKNGMTEAAKMVALNAGGGRGNSTTVVNNPSLVDELIGGRSNPNVF